MYRLISRSRHPISNPGGISPNVLRITAVSYSSVSGLPHRAKTTPPAISLSRVISSALWMARSASGHSTAGPGTKAPSTRLNDKTRYRVIHRLSLAWMGPHPSRSMSHCTHRSGKPASLARYPWTEANAPIAFFVRILQTGSTYFLVEEKSFGSKRSGSQASAAYVSPRRSIEIARSPVIVAAIS